ncbi:triphosphoribosyl-dephospho-CoA synthase [Mycobacterium sp. ST-F2]|uniref:triphosphoribosyl-dephospho-CoA synthase n=1 Tax=Mycobacterium sp. ST-F2 TaxID=1490484 RepID=UPI0009653BEC|nr:triphosphoribosyl-dephospho-CoA synthase [Mycobacterium sp. ST-F2]OKH79814.1 triphosphoribosyl-dephospho-CoA synthase [Mycobacterium sp. ST-F2]
MPTALRQQSLAQQPPREQPLRLPPREQPPRLDQIADAAVAALLAEAYLTPKPGLVDGRGNATHPDMSLPLLAASAEALRKPLRDCAEAARSLALGPVLRAEIGIIGRDGEQRMLAATGRVNTHRGALWALGLLAAGVAVAESVDAAAGFAAQLAAIPDPAGVTAPLSHGQRARVRYGAGGAVAEACGGFPHVVYHGLPALRATRVRGGNADSAALDALMAIMASLDDTCVLHRGGRDGLAFVQRCAAQVLRSGGHLTAAGRAGLDRFCAEAERRHLSMGGSADLLAAVLFLDAMFPDPPEGLPCRP